MPEDRTGFRRPKRLYFDHEGVNVNSPLDAPRKPRRLARMKNMTVEMDGTLTTRPGFANLYAANALVVAGQTPVHSVRRISDDETGTWARIIGAGTHLAVELSASAGTTNSIDSGYSGRPFTTAAWRPTESAELHLYVADDSRMRKVSLSGVDKQIGLPAPNVAPSAELGIPYWKRVSDMETAAAWTQGGVAGAPSLFAGKRVNTTLEASTGLLYDSGTSGWGCFRPVDMTDIGPGSLLKFVNGFDNEDVRVTEVHRAGAATTIASIVYLSGTTGTCTIQPTNSVEEFTRNAVVKLVNGGTTEYCRVLADIPGLNGGRCIKISTTNTWAAGHSIQVVNSFRTHTFITFVSGSNVTQEAIQSIGTGVGVMTLTDTVTTDLTLVSNFSGGNEVPMSNEDYFSCSILASDLSLVTNIRLLFSMDAGTFTDNFFYRTIEQSVLVAAAKNTQSSVEIVRRQMLAKGGNIVEQRRSPRQDILEGEVRPARTPREDGQPFTRYEGTTPNVTTPIPPSGETGTGDNQWSELIFTRGSCIRVGSDRSKGWKDIVAVRVEVTCTAAVTIAFNSLNVNGGFSPDVGELGEPYQYRYRCRDSSTGVTSDYSPECLERIFVYRGQVVLSLPVVFSAEVDKIDIERFGGSQPQWLLVGTVAVSAGTFTDTISDLAAANNAPFSDLRVLQPWVRYGAPLSGTASVVAGNFLNSTSAVSNSLIPGTRITVNGIATGIRRMIGTGSTTTKWELLDSIGAATNAAWEIPLPAYAGQNLGAIWRHDTDTYSVMFACDGPYVRWGLGNNPDATKSTNRLELTESNDPTVMGFSYNGRCGVFTTKRLFWLTGDPVNGFRKDEVPDGHGLFSRHALAVKGRIAWLAQDGIYETGGTAPDSDIIDTDLGPLFVNEEGGAVPTAINGVKAPKIASAEAQYLRLDYADDGSLFFFYRDPSANRACLRYIPHAQAWRPYEFVEPLTFVYSEEGRGVRSLLAGDANGRLHLVGGAAAPNTDNGTGFAWEAQTFCEDFGDSRPNKRIGDLEVDCNPNGQTVNVEMGINNHTTTTALTAITGASQVQRLYDLSSGNGTRARNVSLKVSGTTTAGLRPRLFSWEPSVLEYPADTILRATEWQNGGYNGDKYMQGVKIHADTYGQPKVLRVVKDGGTLIDTITVNHNGERRESYWFTNTVDSERIARLVRFETTDTDPWTLIEWEWVFNREPPLAGVWEIQYTGVDAQDYFHVFQILLALTSSANVTMKTYIDGGVLLATDTIASTGGLMIKTTPTVLPAAKTKMIKWRLESASPFRLYQRDCAIWTMAYGGQDYGILKPFGDTHRDRGAEI